MQLTDFTLAELSAAINLFPVQWGRVGQLGLFPDRGLRTRSVMIESNSGTLSVLPSTEWGAPGTVADKIQRDTFTFGIKQTTHDDTVLPADAQDVRAFGTDNQLSALPTEVARRLQRMRAKHDITLEWKRMGALKGVVLNSDGTSVLADMFTQFGVSKVTVFFDLSNAASDILAACAAVKNQIEDNLKGDTMTSVRVLVSPEFYQALIKHPKVVDAYKYHSEAAQRLGTDMRAGFSFGGLVFEEYRAAVNGVRFIDAGAGHAFPEGTMDTMWTYYAPADFNETVNTIALPFYAKTWPKEGDRGVVLHTQCNSLPLCHQPAVLVEVSADAA